MVVVGLLLGTGCSQSPPSPDLFGDGTGLAGSEGAGDGATSTTAGQETGDDTAAGDDASTATGILLDVGHGTGAATANDCIEGVDCGCTAVDILFVIDNSTSMGSYQQALAAAAPGFADAIFSSLPPNTSIHVGVTTSSFYGDGGGSPGEINCSPHYAGSGLTGRDDFYEYYWLPDEMPYGENGAQGRLREHEGLTFFSAMSDDDPAALESWLSGNITAVGESGSVFEMVTAGAAYPFHPANAAANDGFVRDAGAVLAIFALTDEVDNSPEEVDAYRELILSAKQACGGEQCIVTGGVMQPCLATAPDNRLYPLLASFGQEPVVADIGPELDDCFDDCADGDITECDLVQPPVTCQELEQGGATPQYADALGGALAQVIAETCQDIPPAG